MDELNSILYIIKERIGKLEERFEKIIQNIVLKDKEM